MTTNRLPAPIHGDQRDPDLAADCRTPGIGLSERRDRAQAGMKPYLGRHAVTTTLPPACGGPEAAGLTQQAISARKSLATDSRG